MSSALKAEGRWPVLAGESAARRLPRRAAPGPARHPVHLLGLGEQSSGRPFELDVHASRPWIPPPANESEQHRLARRLGQTLLGLAIVASRSIHHLPLALCRPDGHGGEPSVVGRCAASKRLGLPLLARHRGAVPYPRSFGQFYRSRRRRPHPGQSGLRSRPDPELRSTSPGWGGRPSIEYSR